jgi:hypothetical protein
MASYFFLRGQEKVTKKKATPTSPNSRILNLPGGAERGESQNRSGESVNMELLI